MNRRKEICRNFQRGSCQYGDRCKFLHVTQQQSKPNPFGFGTQNTLHFPNTTQQQKPNPFGFGVQNNTQLQNNTHLKGSSNFGSRNQSPAKPFENKWVRPTSTTSHTEAQPQAPAHKCTDPESCKRQIVEDFKNEAPLWKLTCYGHRKNGPCDIVGDISFEELRAAAYDDAKRGLSIQSIVERERSLYLSKLNEFDNLLENPYGSQNLGFPQMSQSPMSTNNASSANVQSNVAPSYSSFSQLKAAANFGPNSGTNPPGTPSGAGFGQPIPIQNASQTSVGFGMKFGAPGVFGQQPTQPSGSFQSPSISMFNIGVRPTGSPFPLVSQQFGVISNQPLNSLTGPSVPSITVQQASVDEKEVSPDDSIWLKEEWKIGEIPERPPPDRFC